MRIVSARSPNAGGAIDVLLLVMTSPGPTPRKRPVLLSAITFLFALSVHADSYSVTTVADEGPGSFRQGLLDINSGTCNHPCTIAFAIPGPAPGAGSCTSQP